MSDIGPGDLVVCVDLTPRGTRFDESLASLRVGSIYRVENLHGPGLILERVRSSFPSGAYHASHFRKFNDEPDNAEVLAMIRKCKPMKQGVPA